ncbi:MAG: hypothetical protein HUJ25_10605 [Crocinitomicaceae bacterium]|nr:hypothetical protein [Crocinitomicaceae bacterium]
MDTATHIEEYLEQVIQFKQTKDLHPGYKNEQERKQLLHELTIELGFDPSLWELRKEQATFYFFIFDHIQDDSDLRSTHEKSYRELCLHFIEKAINLDPYNADYLKAYLFEHQNVWTPKKFRKIQYIQLFKPTSTILTSLQVDLGIRPDELYYDYFIQDIIGPFVNEMVFLQEKGQYDIQYTPNETLKDLASQAGIDKSTLQEIKKEVDHMHDVVDNTYDNHWLNWNELHKAWLTVDRMTDLAPYRPVILEAALLFYGRTLWRSILGLNRIDAKTVGYEEFCQAFYGKTKPKRQDKIDAAIQALEKAKELEKRYVSLPSHLFQKKDMKNVFMDPLKFQRLMRHQGDLRTPVQASAFLKAESLMHNVYMQHEQIKVSNFRFSIIVGALLYLISALLCIFLFGSIHLLWTFIFIPAFAAMAISHLRLLWWKKKKLGLNIAS